MRTFPSRCARRFGAAAGAGLAICLMLAATASAHAPVVVSLTFDDAQGDTWPARQILADHKVHATFFVNSGFVDRPGRLSWAQIQALYADGNEIGGHTINHTSIPAVAPDQAKWEICDDRAALAAHGFPVTDFAYPYAFHTLDTDPIVASCGYNSARGIGGIVSPGYCPYCDYAERIPPPYPMYTLAPQPVMSDTSLETLEGYVTQAEDHGGGWVQLVFHHLCDGCDPYATTEAQLTALLDWLGPRTADGTVVKTVQEVVGGAVQPIVRGDTQAPVSTALCGAGPCTGGWYRDAVSVSLGATDEGGSGLDVIRYTTDGTDPTAASPVYTTPLSLTASKTVKWRAYDRQGNAEAVRSQLVRVDSAAPTVAIVWPRAGAKIRGFETLLVSASDAGSGLASVSYRLDGRPIGASSDPGSGYRLVWDSRPLPNGRHLLTAVATDNVGHATTSSPVSVSLR
ncbi:MAG: hypothetical protein QOK31_901 [Solirubrobacteraceae bacterium]|nr:hypothetical protein [Solirubrobacteraceae bacterium]